MSKQLNYLMVVEQLTGDSRVMFFATPELAKQAFDNLTQPLIKVCMENYYDTDEQDVFYHTKEGKGVRFNSGELEALDDLIGDNNVYYEWDSVEVADDVTHYVAEFSEWVDEGGITFHAKDNAVKVYNDRIDDGLQIAKDHHGHSINRYDKSTWESGEKGTLFTEAIDTSVNHSDAFFGYSDVYYTYRCGEIDVMDSKVYTVFATGGYLKRPEIYTLTVDPTDPDTLAEIADFKCYDEYLEYVLEEEEGEWGQKFVKCNIIPKDQMDNILKQDEEEGGE